MRRRRRGWGSVAVAVVLAAAAPLSVAPAAGSAPEVRGPDAHVAGIGLDRPAGPPRSAPVPWLARPGSDARPVRAAPVRWAAPARDPLAPVVIPPGAFDALPNLFPFATPADPTGALGVDNHVAAVNVHLSAYSRAGVELYPPKRLRSLDPQLPSGVEDFDPKVVYDPYDHAFLVVFMSATASTSFMSIVVIPEGAEDDATQTDWCTLHMRGDQIAGNGNQLADYPMVGFTGNRVTLTTNQFDLSTLAFRYVQIVSFRKADLYDCQTDPVPIEVIGGRRTKDPDGSKAFTIVPAISVGGDPRSQFMASIDVDGTTGKLLLWRLRRVNGVLTLNRVQVSSGPARIAPFGFQCGSTQNSNTWWDTGDLRLTSAFWDADLGRLYTAMALRGNKGGGDIESVVKWWEVDPASTLSNSDVLRTGTVGAPGRDAGWPSVATDADGNLWVNYARAGLTECLSAYAALVTPGTRAAASVRYREGELRYERLSGPERWGDYTALTRDPVDPTIMAAYGAYAIDDGVGMSTDRWRHTIATLEDA